MKALLIASTILFGSAAMAQDTGQAPSSQPMQSDTAPANPDAGMTPPADGAMTPPPAGGMQQQPGTGQPGMAQPGAPAPAMSAPGGAPMANAPAAGDPSTYPTCSRTVTDRCVNRGKR